MDHALCSKAMVLFFAVLRRQISARPEQLFGNQALFSANQSSTFFMPKICFTLDFDIESGRMNMTN